MIESVQEMNELLRSVDAACAEISPLLAGLGPERQGAILAALTARWVAGWHPDLRQRMLDDLIMLVHGLVESEELELYGPAGFPKDGLQ